MKELALMFGSCFVILIGVYARTRTRNISNWLESRRIDSIKVNDTAICNECGGTMKRRTYKEGHRKGSSALVCEYYPECTNRKWGI